MEWIIAVVVFVGLFALARGERKGENKIDFPITSESVIFETPEELYEAAAQFEQNRYGRELSRHTQKIVVLTDYNSGHKFNWEGWNYARVFFNFFVPEDWQIIDQRSPKECGPSPLFQHVEPLIIRKERDRKRTEYQSPSGKVIHGGRYTGRTK